MWARATTGHPATCMSPSPFGAGPGKYPFFVDYIYCGLCSPYSDFFIDLMLTYEFQLLDFTPNAVTSMAFFAHLFKNFAEVTPRTVLFLHYFPPPPASNRAEPFMAPSLGSLGREPRRSTPKGI